MCTVNDAICTICSIIAAEPRTRPKLQLQPRTKPVEPIVIAEEGETAEGSTESKSASSTQQAPTPTPAANIFGAAKPVDMAAKEREIEERLAKSYAESRSREETCVYKQFNVLENWYS